MECTTPRHISQQMSMSCQPGRITYTQQTVSSQRQLLLNNLLLLLKQELRSCATAFQHISPQSNLLRICTGDSLLHLWVFMSIKMFNLSH